MPSDQNRIIEQAKFTYSPLNKAFQKQIKAIEEQDRKKINPITNQNKSLEAFSQ